MAAPAAILISLPGMAMAQAASSCGAIFMQTTFLGRNFPAIEHWLQASPDSEQWRTLLQPDSLVTGAILIWLIASSGTRATMAAIGWFLFLALYHAYVYLTADVTGELHMQAVALGCIEHSPRRVLTNLGFAAIAGILMWQRIRRQTAA